MYVPRQSFSPQEIDQVAEVLKVSWLVHSRSEFEAGMQIELEHGLIDTLTNVTNDEAIPTAKIVLAHLNEVPDYYTKLETMVEPDNGREEAPTQEEIKNLHKEAMPYPGISSKDLPKMERCINDLMNDPKMKEKHSDLKERKSHAIAICHNSISGEGTKKDVGNENTMNMITETLPITSVKKGGEIEMTKKEEKVEKVEDVKKEVVVEKPVTEVKTEVVVEKAVTEVKTETTEVKPETKVEEVVVEKAKPAPKDEEKEDPKEEAKESSEEEEGEDKKDTNPEHGKPGHKCDAKCKEYKAKAVVSEYNPEKIEALSNQVIALTAKLDLMVTLMKQAPAAGGSAKEEAPKEVVKVETPKEVAKSDTSTEGTELLKAFGEIKKSLEERIDKLEKQPAPSKVVVYAREFAGQPADAGDMTLEKINGELEKLETLKNTDPNRYMNDGAVDRAFELVKMKKQFNAKK